MRELPIDRRTVLQAAAAGAAAVGLTGTAAGHGLPNTISIEATGEYVEYSVEVSGEIERGGNADTEDEVVGDGRAEGAVHEDGEDTFRFSGEVTAFDADGPVEVFVNGEEVDPDELGESDLPNEVVLRGLGDDDVEVRIEVDGEIEKGRLADDSDEIRDGNVAIARIDGDAKKERDSFRFSGSVVEVDVRSGDAELTITVTDLAA